MKKTVLFFLFLFLFTSCTGVLSSESQSAVTEKDRQMSSLKKALDVYSDATIKNNVSVLLSFVYPKVFTLISKERMHKILTNVYESKKAPHIIDIIHKNISNIKVYDKGLYSIINSKMTMELKSPIVDNDKFEELLLDKLKSQMGENAEITLNNRKHIFTVKKQSQIIAIKEGKEGWKFVGYEQAKKYASKRVIPESIMRNIE
jgi:hypothetical protein